MVILPSIIEDHDPQKAEVVEIAFKDDSLGNYFGSFPNELEMSKILSDAFVINRPMSGVGGDGYWIQKTEDIIHIVAFDCMGHGRLASMMTRIYLNCIKKVIMENGIKSPADVLNNVHEEIKEIFKNKDNILIGTAADVAIVNYHYSGRTKKIEYSGAKMDLILVRCAEVERIRAHKRQIGSFFEQERKYETHTFEVSNESKTKIYLYSDGVTDLIGSENDKKLGFQNLKSIIEDVCHLPMSLQKDQIERQLIKWMGINIPYDDLLLLGFSI